MVAETLERIDVGALSGSVVCDVRFRLSGIIASLVTTLEDENEPLSEKQMTHLLSYLLNAFDGFEREVAGTLVKELGEAGVPLWGLPRALKDLVDA
jgi:hypothetical protein